MSATAHLPQIAKIASVAKAAAYETITAAPASPHIGAEIGAVDLTRPLANKQVEELHDAFARYQVLFFRDQNISFEDQIRVAGYFGRLGKHVGKSTISKTTDNPYASAAILPGNVGSGAMLRPRDRVRRPHPVDERRWG